VLNTCSSPLTPKEVSDVDVQMSVAADIWSDYSQLKKTEFLMTAIQMKWGEANQGKMYHLLSIG